MEVLSFNRNLLNKSEEVNGKFNVEEIRNLSLWLQHSGVTLSAFRVNRAGSNLSNLLDAFALE
jgi:hypothetical protein